MKIWQKKPSEKVEKIYRQILGRVLKEHVVRHTAEADESVSLDFDLDEALNLTVKGLGKRKLVIRSQNGNEAVLSPQAACAAMQMIAMNWTSWRLSDGMFASEAGDEAARLYHKAYQLLFYGDKPKELSNKDISDIYAYID